MHLRAVAQPALPLPDTAYLADLPSGAEGTRRTLVAMRRMVNAARIDPRIRNLALSITRGLPNKAYGEEARAVHGWVQKNIEYRRDVHGVETLTPPVFTLATRAGDCDDQAMLVAALLESIGHPTRFVAVGYTPDAFRHVYTEANVRGEWMPLETTEPVEAGVLAAELPVRMVLDASSLGSLGDFWSKAKKAVKKVTHKIEHVTLVSPLKRTAEIADKAGIKPLAKASDKLADHAAKVLREKNRLEDPVGRIVVGFFTGGYVGAAVAVAAECAAAYARHKGKKDLAQMRKAEAAYSASLKDQERNAKIGAIAIDVGQAFGYEQEDPRVAAFASQIDQLWKDGFDPAQAAGYTMAFEVLKQRGIDPASPASSINLADAAPAPTVLEVLADSITQQLYTGKAASQVTLPGRSTSRTWMLAGLGFAGALGLAAFFGGRRRGR